MVLELCLIVPVSFLAALAALYLTLVSESVSQWLVTGCHFRILTQRVTFETLDQENNNNKDNENEDNNKEDNENNNNENNNNENNDNENNENNDNENNS